MKGMRRERPSGLSGRWRAGCEPGEVATLESQAPRRGKQNAQAADDSRVTNSGTASVTSPCEAKHGLQGRPRKGNGTYNIAGTRDAHRMQGGWSGGKASSARW